MAKIASEASRRRSAACSRVGGVVGYAHRMKSSRHVTRLAGRRRAPGRRRGRRRGRRFAAPGARGDVRVGAVRRRRVPPAHAGAHLRLPSGVADQRRRPARRQAASRARAGHLRHRPARPGRHPGDGRRRARRRRQHHRHRARRERLPRGLRQGRQAGRAHLDPQLHGQPDRAQRVDRAPGRRRPADDRPVRPERHGPRDRRRVRLVLDQRRQRHRCDRRCPADPDHPVARPRHPRRPVNVNRTPAAPLGRRQTIDAADPRRRRRQPVVSPTSCPTTRTSAACCSTWSASPRPGSATHTCRCSPTRCRPAQDPTTSNLNLAPNSIKANLVFVPVGADGNVRIFNNQGNTDVVADVVGYMLSGPDPDITRRPRRAAVVAVPHLRHPRAAVGRRRPRAGSGRGLELRRLRQLGGASAPTAGRQPAGRDRQPHLGIASPGSTRRVPVSSFLTAYPADARRAALVEPQHHRGPAASPTWPCHARTAPTTRCGSTTSPATRTTSSTPPPSFSPTRLRRHPTG